MKKSLKSYSFLLPWLKRAMRFDLWIIDAICTYVWISTWEATNQTPRYILRQWWSKLPSLPVVCKHITALEMRGLTKPTPLCIYPRLGFLLHWQSWRPSLKTNPLLEMIVQMNQLDCRILVQSSLDLHQFAFLLLKCTSQMII